MKYVITLPEDGRQVKGEFRWPAFEALDAATRRAAAQQIQATLKQMKQMKGQPWARAERRMLAALTPGIAAQIAAQLPRAAPARTVTHKTEDGGTHTVTTDKRRAVPPPTLRAIEIAERLAPYVAAELLTANYVSTVAAGAPAMQAAAAKAQELVARLDRLEARQMVLQNSRIRRVVEREDRSRITSTVETRELAGSSCAGPSVRAPHA